MAGALVGRVPVLAVESHGIAAAVAARRIRRLRHAPQSSDELDGETGTARR